MAVPVPADWDNWAHRAWGRASPACLDLQLPLGGAEGVLHLVLGDGFPLARVFPEEVVPDDGHLVGEAELEGGSTGTGRDRRAAGPGDKEQGEQRQHAEVQAQRVFLVTLRGRIPFPDRGEER